MILLWGDQFNIAQWQILRNTLYVHKNSQTRTFQPFHADLYAYLIFILSALYTVRYFKIYVAAVPLTLIGMSYVSKKNARL